jgi:hypothetical protein
MRSTPSCTHPVALNKCGDFVGYASPFPGRPFPGNTSLQRPLDYDARTGRLALCDVSPVGTIPVVRYTPVAPNIGPPGPWASPLTVVVAMPIPPGFKGSHAEVYTSTPCQTPGTVDVAVYYGNNLLAGPWDASINGVITIPLGGDEAVGGDSLLVRAIINPARWPGGANPVASQVFVDAAVRLFSLGEVPSMPC